MRLLAVVDNFRRQRGRHGQINERRQEFGILRQLGECLDRRLLEDAVGRGRVHCSREALRQPKRSRIIPNVLHVEFARVRLLAAVAILFVLLIKIIHLEELIGDGLRHERELGWELHRQPARHGDGAVVRRDGEGAEAAGVEAADEGRDSAGRHLLRVVTAAAKPRGGIVDRMHHRVGKAASESRVRRPQIFQNGFSLFERRFIPTRSGRSKRFG